MDELYKQVGLSILILFIVSACGNQSENLSDVGSDDVTSLPFQTISLENLDEFRNPGDNWSITGNVFTEFDSESALEVEDGSGIIVNRPSDNQGSELVSELEHGDLELVVDVLVPKGSNSGIYMQGRYELQILDSWKVDEPGYSDAGGIYERWDDSQPEGSKGYEGKAPTVNASLAPGLWQEYHILFRAPRFDDSGNKTENARFERVYMNGVLIHEDVELSGPTRGPFFDDEVAEAPFVIQGDHGEVAFRDFRYKHYSQSDSLELGPLTYQVYDYDGDRTPVDFDSLEQLEEGTTNAFEVSDLGPKNEHYATRIMGEFTVPVSGDYLFQSQMENGGNFYVNGDLVLENTGEFGGYQPGKIINLEEGTHEFELTHFQIMWGMNATILYEGPGMEKRILDTGKRVIQEPENDPVVAEIRESEAEIVGGFTEYGGKKRTHTLSVGNPEGIHYSYDLNNAMLLKFWRNPFADVTQMWRGRGIEQLLIPMNAAIDETAGIPLVDLSNSEFFDTHVTHDEVTVESYQLDDHGRPIFYSNMGGIEIWDHMEPDEDDQSFIRTLRFSADESSAEKAARLAQSTSIETISETLFRIGGSYYLEILNTDNQTAEIIESDGNQALIIPVLSNTNESEIQYQLIW
ncbi:MAG: family 16 glycoside hydrolase [Balneolaceae bacterium]